MSLEAILKLPFEIQLVLAAGYLAYRVANTGLDQSHKTIDTIFQVLAYGLVAYLMYGLADKHFSSIVAVNTAAAVLSAIIAAGLWRRFGRKIFVAIARKAGVMRENLFPSTWAHLINDNQKWGYIAVTRDDDVKFESNLAALPNGIPLEPVDVDHLGNIALYVTRTISPSGEIGDHSENGVVDEHGRAHLTFIPANKIKTVTVSLDVTS